MLEKILDSHKCADCQICCGFNREDIWETPVIFSETRNYILENIKNNQKFIQKGSAYLFDMQFTDEKEEVVFCPMLDRKKGCILGQEKPFDCRIWPFRIMLYHNTLVITIAVLCPELRTIDKSKLSSFLSNEGVAEEIYKAAYEHPEIVKPYVEGYPIIFIL